MNKNKVLIASLLMALLYLIVAISEWTRLFNTRAAGWSSLFALTTVKGLIPSIVLVFIGMIMSVKAYKRNKRSIAVVSVIVYLCGALIGTQWGILLIPAAVLGLIAIIQMGIQAKKAKTATEDLLP